MSKDEDKKGDGKGAGIDTTRMSVNDAGKVELDDSALDDAAGGLISTNTVRTNCFCKPTSPGPRNPTGDSGTI